VVTCEILATVLAFEILHAKVNDAIIEVLSTQMSVASGGFHFKDSVLDCEERHIESATTHVVDENIPLTSAFFVQAIGDGCCSWFIDNAQDIETTDASGILGGLALRIVEVGWYCHNCIIHLCSKVGLGGFLHFREYHRRHFFSVEFLVFALEIDLNHWLIACS